MVLYPDNNAPYPVGDNVLVIQLKDKEQIVNGIIIPNNNHATHLPCKVMRTGPNTKEINVGDIIAITPYSGKQLIDNDITYLIVKEENVLAILKLGDPDGD